MVFETVIPEDMASVIRKFENYTTTSNWQKTVKNNLIIFCIATLIIQSCNLFRPKHQTTPYTLQYPSHFPAPNLPPTNELTVEGLDWADIYFLMNVFLVTILRVVIVVIYKKVILLSRSVLAPGLMEQRAM